MGTTSKRTSSRKVVGVSLAPGELKKLDAQRAQLGGIPRPTAMKLMWSHMGDAAIDLALKRQATAGAAAQAVEPLVDAMQALDEAWTSRAHQRRAIGVHSNQIAKLANLERISVRDGGQVTEETAEMLTAALQGVERRLAELERAEREDAQLRADLRALIDQYRAAS